VTVKVKSTKPPVQQIQAVRVQRKEGFISRCIKIVIDDIRHKIYGYSSKERQEWEDYERFCKLSRGER
jgi:hypothetical protein